MSETWLVIDSTSLDLRVSLIQGEKCVSSDPSLIPGRDLSIKLLPMMDNLLKESSCTLSDLNGIALCLGPGSFTGTRIAIATCRAIAECDGPKIVGFTLFHAQALYFASQCEPSKDQKILCMVHARADIHYRAVMELCNGIPGIVEEPCLTRVSDIDPGSMEVVATWDRDGGEPDFGGAVTVHRYRHSAIPAQELVRSIQSGASLLPGPGTGGWKRDIMPLYLQEPFATAKDRTLPGLV
jgi:tRNA threonylcarbamoyl adenosine modification protein YeaZ